LPQRHDETWRAPIAGTIACCGSALELGEVLLPELECSTCWAHALGERHEAGRRRTITVNLAYAAVRVGPQQVDALNRAILDARLEDKRVNTVAGELVGIAELLEHAGDRAKNRCHSRTALIPLEHRRTAEDNILSEKVESRIEIGMLDRSRHQRQPPGAGREPVAAQAARSRSRPSSKSIASTPSSSFASAT
jgi:hypothetical protein